MTQGRDEEIEAALDAALEGCALPRHIGVIVDGNRRWAREVGVSTAEGHREGARRIADLLDWCDELSIPLVTVWMLSTDNLSRPPEELEALYGIITDAVERCAGAGYTVRIVGRSELLPARVHARLAAILDAARPIRDLHVNLAIGYGGRQEIVDAVQAILREGAASGLDADALVEAVSIDAISHRLYTHDQADPDLIIRTSGEQRMSGFLLWQSVHSEYWFCEANWPAFARADLLRALADYCARERRFGS